jgi:hypothetical protein
MGWWDQFTYFMFVLVLTVTAAAAVGYALGTVSRLLLLSVAGPRVDSTPAR